jgi:TRAP transporter TAXI family solute receptor
MRLYVPRLLRQLLLATTLIAGATAGHAAEFVNVLTGGTSGVYYPLGVTLSQIYGEAIPDSKVQVQATKASAENLNLLQAGRGEIGFSLADSVSDAWKGNADAGFKAARQNCAVIASVYPNYIQIVALARRGHQTLADLKGKRISVGAPKLGHRDQRARRPQGRRPDLCKDFSQGRVPALRRVGRTHEEPPDRRHAAVGRPRCGRCATCPPR